MTMTLVAKYALRCLAYLARFGSSEPIPLRKIGEAQRIPHTFMTKVFESLMETGLVRLHRGAETGYTLGRPASEISFRHVVEAVDGPGSVGCGLGFLECPGREDCAISQSFGDIESETRRILDQATVENLSACEGVVE